MRRQKHRERLEAVADDLDRIGAALDPAAVARELLSDLVGNTGGEAVAWLALPDADGAVTLAHLRGDRTGLRRGLVVAPGQGLTGSVLRDASPQWVDDYFGSSGITHDFDREVGAEGIRRMVSAPVLLAGQRRGVLILALRTAGGIGDRTISRLEQLADRAAYSVALAETASAMSRTAVMEDRQRTAEALHDTVGALLFGIRSEPARVRRRLGTEHELLGTIDEIDSDAAEAAAALRASLGTLRAPEGQQTVVDLRSLCRDFEERSGRTAHFVLVNDLGPVEERIGCLLVGVVRESLLNVEKHAFARSVAVTVARGRTGFRLAVTDNGVGFTGCGEPSADPAAGVREGGGLGLAALRSRVRRNGGTLSVTKNDHGGVTIKAWLPS
ncbi:GAF domain-containing sensor histidine kinase [Streptomyces ipomoeae]|uniref:GAF domain-containing sensor histidine kinase n=1 Tax=Streptomyces ipomoeae TaxID=103232 RepID=UPI001146A5C5|nr:GAF domain-containing protein [Streptomyces ipomoeae]MDX2937744.1 GAF domain-containing protein [Streptomyces ipomoeae]TQE17249.1 histidine kinase [Streptomyces ipomoeae]